VVTIAVPPLRERGEDILVLAQGLLQTYAAETTKKYAGFARQAITALQTYGWPGNVRELENKIKRAVVVAEGQRLTPEDLELAAPSTPDKGRGLRKERKALEMDLIQRTLAKQRGNITQTAVALGISRPTLRTHGEAGD